MKRTFGVLLACALAVGCGRAPAGAPVAPQLDSPLQATGILPNLAYQFLGPQLLVFRFDVDAAKVRNLVDPRFAPEVKNGKSPVFAILAEYHAASVLGLPAARVKAREITYTVLCDKTGPKGDRKGFASFRIIEDKHVFTWLVRDVGYSATTAPLGWVRAGNRIESSGEADFALTRKTDALSRLERTATLSRLMVGKNDHLLRKGDVTEVPFLYPNPILDAYAVKIDRARFGTLAELGLIATGQQPADAWWWDGVNFIVGKREHYPAPAVRAE